MDLTKADYELFDQEEFTFKKLKEQRTEAEIEQIKTLYKKHWTKWKEMQLLANESVSESLNITKPKIESWTNGWNLRNHFWSAYRSDDRQNENACLAVLLNKKQLQIYLMFQHYKSEKRNGTVETYNALLKQLTEWSKKTDISDYYIWPQQESEFKDHLPLKEYLENPNKQQALHQQLEDRSFQLGKFYFRPTEVEQVEQKISQALLELSPLYQQLAEN
ncbi:MULTISPECIES: HI_0552 family protein [unclassified Enterococcus]|jgi:hypothetical protein|uniref:HI_0552 family protein n=1 Tax=unclassified Enterococcus TaxID=2608891 RepID=UPI003D2D7526